MRSKVDFENVRVVDERSTDVLVAGGGIAGIFAALGAARSGAGVVLIEASGFLGGQGTVGGVHTFCGDTELVNEDWRAMLDRLAEFDDAIAPYDPNEDGRRFSAEHLKYVAQDLLERAGVEVILHATVVSAHRDETRMSHVLMHDASGLHRLRALQFVDATGDADLVWDAGWATTSGGPSFAPAPDGVTLIPDRLPLPMSLYFALVDTGSPVEPVSPAGAPAWGDDDDLPMTSVYEHGGLIMVKMKVTGFDAADGRSLSAAEQQARRQALALVHHLQTKGYLGRSYPSHRLAWIAPHIGIREGRRIQPIVELTLGDLMSGASFDDAVAVGSYHIDYHWPADPRRAGTGLTAQVPPYQIPLRAMRPLGSDNVLVPGRCMGGEQIAMSSYRVMAICAQTGFGAGCAAGLAAGNGVGLDELETARLRAVLRSAGVRLDQAPYLRYLRARRSFSGSVPLADAQDVAVAAAADGSVLTAAANADGVWLARTVPGGETSMHLVLPGPAGHVELVSPTRRLFPAAPGTVVEESDGPAPAILRVDAEEFEVDVASGDAVRRGSAGRVAKEVVVPAHVWSPGKPQPDLRLRLRRGALERAIDGPWEEAVPASHGAVATSLAATAGGVLLAGADEVHLWFEHVPYDVVLGLTAGHPANEHNTGFAWLDLLQDLERAR